MKERHIVKPKTFDHLRDFIFCPGFVETLKASEQNIQRGHAFAVREALATTFKLYQQDAATKGIDSVSERVYRRVLSQKLFTKYRKDHCMCST